MATPSPHETCTAHSGLHVKVNLQLALSGVAMILLAALLNVAIDIKGNLATGLARLEGRVDVLEQRVKSLEESIK